MASFGDEAGEEGVKFPKDAKRGLKWDGWVSCKIDPRFVGLGGRVMNRELAKRLVAWVVVPSVLAALVVGQASLFRWNKCETYDEFTYLRLGICIFRDLNFEKLGSPMCPPLPIWLEYAAPGLWAKEEPGTDAWEWEVPGLIQLARLSTSVVIGVPLVWTVYGWLWRRRGWMVGAFGGGLTALSPTVLAAVSIATTDGCFALFSVVALGMLRWYQERPSRTTLLAAGAGIGLALASKQSAAFLFPIVLVELMLKYPHAREGDTRVDTGLRILFVTAGRFALVVATAFFVDEALYGFGTGQTFRSGGAHVTIPVIIPMIAQQLPNEEAIMDAVRAMGAPLAIDTFMGQVDHATSGHLAFFMGQRSSQGWWYFFPAAIAMKSTPSELVLFGIAAVLALSRRVWTDPARRLWLGSIVVMLGLGVSSRINIGHRYMLVIYPMAILLASDVLGAIGPERRRLATTAAGLLLLGQAVSAATIAPHYLSYFNSLCGGPLQGYRYLADSSLDWGQDLPMIRRALEAHGYHKVALGYFGTAKPEIYGLNYMDMSSPFEDPFEAGCDWVAISATRLQGVYAGGTPLIRYFGGLPAERVGYTSFLYNLKDPRVQEALRASRP